MSVAEEITRLQGLRNRIRTKLIGLGLNVSSSASLSDCTTAVEGIASNGAVSITLDATSGNQSKPIAAGYHNGNGTAQIVLDANNTFTTNGTKTPESGKVFGSVVINVQGSATLQEKSVTPTTSAQDVLPDAGYDGMSKVAVGAIPSNYADVSNVTAIAGEVLATKVFVTAAGTETAGTMVNNGTVAATIDGITTTSYTIPAGYHSGSGTVSLDSTIENTLATI